MPPKSATAAAAKAAFEPKLVHAYRRQPHMALDVKTGNMVEKPVEVMFMGEKVLFASNEQGYIVGEVKNEATYNRLVKEIPEAYIPYNGGEGVPETKILAAEHQSEEKPKGKFVLESAGADGKPEYKVLDNLSDTEVRAFADEIGIEAEALHASLTGESLQQALFNLLQTS